MLSQIWDLESLCNVQRISGDAKIKDEPILSGQHSCTPTVGEIGSGNRQNPVVGDETGRFIFYEKKDLTY